MPARADLPSLEPRGLRREQEDVDAHNATVTRKRRFF